MGNMGNMGTNRGNSANAPGHNKPSNPASSHGDRLNPNNNSVCPDSGAELVGPLGEAGKSQVAHVNFLPAVQSTGEPATGDSSWARMMYFWLGSTFDFVLNAHGLTAGDSFTLVALASDGSAICLGNGMVNAGGQLHVLGSVDPGANLPADLDPFAPRTDATVDTTLQLFPTASVDCTTGALTPVDGNVLQSVEGIRFVDVDVLVCPTPT
jgi:hypothetical protein